MDKVFIRVRGILANAGMARLHDETRKLIDKYGYDGAEDILQAQFHILYDMRELEEKEDDDNGDEL